MQSLLNNPWVLGAFVTTICVSMIILVIRVTSAEIAPKGRSIKASFKFGVKK